MSKNFKVKNGLETTNITASSDISASGDLYADDLFIDNISSLDNNNTTLRLGFNAFHTGVSIGRTGQTTETTIFGPITASGDISSSGTIFASKLEVTEITSSIVSSSTNILIENITSSGDSVFGNEASDTHTFTGAITASGDISSSGDIFGNSLIIGPGEGDFSQNVVISGSDGNILMQGNNDGGDVSLTIRNSAAGGSTDETTSIIFGTNDQIGKTPALIRAGREQVYAGITSLEDGFLSFHTDLNGTIAEKLRITSDGKVGVGSTAPGELLTVHGNISSSGTITGNSIVGTLTGQASSVENALTVDDATLQLDSGTTYDGDDARTISVKDGGIDSDALAADISVTSLTSTNVTASANISASGHISASNFISNQIRDVKFSGFFMSTANRVFIPINGSIGEVQNYSSAESDVLGFAAPYDGYLEKVVARVSDNDPGVAVVGLHKSADGTEYPNSDTSYTSTVTMTAEDTSFNFPFGVSSSFSAGEIIAMSFDPFNNPSGNVNMTMVFVYDITTGV